MYLEIQTGPLYSCPECGKPARGIMAYTEFGPAGTLGGWANSVAYLDLGQACRAEGHCSRVARVGNAIAPLPGRTLRGDDPADMERLRETVKYILRNADVGTSDPLAEVVYAVAAGAVAPDDGVARIRAMVYGERGAE